MTADRRSFQRQSEDQRRESLIHAALELMGEGGPRAVTVRAIAEKAGITPGLIRHYFASKDDLVRASYLTLMERLNSDSQASADMASTPAKAIGAIVLDCLRPPVMEGGRIRLWAGFLHLVHSDPALREVHKATYLAFRDRLQALIQQLPGQEDAATARRLSIAINGVLDGLWLEGGLLPGGFEPGEVEAIGLRSVAALLGLTVSDLCPSDGPEGGVKP